MWSSHVAALSMAGKAWNSATVTACLVLAFLFIGLVSQSAHAHKPLFADGQGMSPGTALHVPDPTVSHVLYAELPADSPSFWFTFDASRPGRIPIQLAVPDGTPGEEMELAVVLYPPDWKARIESAGTSPSSPPGLDTPPGAQEDGPVVIRPGQKPEFFHEHVTGTKSWILADTEVDLPEAGTYYGVVHDFSGRGGKIWVAVGRRERFTWRDVWRLPRLISDVRRFHGEPGRPSWMWVAAGVFVAIPPATGLVGRRIIKRKED